MTHAHSPLEFELIRTAVLGAMKGSLKDMPAMDLLELQKVLGFGEDPLRIRVPASWVPPGPLRQNLVMRLVPAGLPRDMCRRVADAVRRLAFVRYLVLPPTKCRRKLPAVSSWMNCVRSLRRAADVAYRAGAIQGESVFARIALTDLHEAFQRVPNGDFKYLCRWKEMRTIDDWPMAVDSDARYEEAIGEVPRPRRKTSVRAQPYDDQLFAALASRAFSYARIWGPSLISALDSLHAVASKRNSHHRSARPILASHGWPQGDPTLHGRLAAPPQRLREFMRRLSALQTCHQLAVSSVVGCRTSELLSMEGLEESSEGAAIVGRIFKTSSEMRGKPFQWPIDESTRAIFAQQLKLRETVIRYHETRGIETRRESGAWIIMSNGSGRPVGSNLNSVLWQFERIVHDLNIAAERLEGGRITSLRLRKTVARMVALTMSDAPLLVKRLFGHKSIETTLNYVHTDKYVHGYLITGNSARSTGEPVSAIAMENVKQGELVRRAVDWSGLLLRLECARRLGDIALHRTAARDVRVALERNSPTELRWKRNRRLARALQEPTRRK
jgi:integrase